MAPARMHRRRPGAVAGMLLQDHRPDRAAVALYCGGVLLFVLMITIIVDVTGRYVFNRPLYGSLDLSITLLVLIVASSIAYGGRTGAHVTADIFSTLVGPSFEWISGIFIKFFAAGSSAIWCWRLFVTGQTAARLGESTLLSTFRSSRSTWRSASASGSMRWFWSSRRWCWRSRGTCPPADR